MSITDNNIQSLISAKNDFDCSVKYWAERLMNDTNEIAISNLFKNIYSKFNAFMSKCIAHKQKYSYRTELSRMLHSLNQIYKELMSTLKMKKTDRLYFILNKRCIDSEFEHIDKIMSELIDDFVEIRMISPEQHERMRMEFRTERINRCIDKCISSYRVISHEDDSKRSELLEAQREKQLEMQRLQRQREQQRIQKFCEESDIDTCAICLESIDGEKTLTECKHVFHKNCIDRWNAVHIECPMCRQQM